MQAASIPPFFCSSVSDSSLTESIEHCKSVFENDFEYDLKLLHCSDELDFQIIDMNDFDF